VKILVAPHSEAWLYASNKEYFSLFGYGIWVCDFVNISRTSIYVAIECTGLSFAQVPVSPEGQSGSYRIDVGRSGIIPLLLMA
jgi:hypothetical protein